MRRTIGGALVTLAALLGCVACTAPAGPAPASSAASAPVAAPSSPQAAPSPPGRSMTVAVLGDSLSRGYNACSHFGDCPSVSWSGGTDDRVDSVATRLGAAAGARVTVRNLARSGATVSDLARQATEAVTLQPDLVTLLIGANDVCRATVADMTSTEDYTTAVSAALQQIAQYSPDTVVLVASIPDVTALLPVAAGNPTARFLWAQGGCATALQDPQSTAPDAVERRAAVSARIREYDAALAGACGVLPRCVTDGGALHRYTPTLQQLSAFDRFHPSVAGLRELAQLEWRALSRSPRAAALLEPAG
ncbi:hypothetical protein GCM10025783_28140 [Amnibacterium soli]|uniref:SGNH hydrolase-type esterase domain-containing protein n=1 Tax=Amnibacterium soli TaxID=1282736 RepID=A0ABP8ZDR0_9MICO